MNLQDFAEACYPGDLDAQKELLDHCKVNAPPVEVVQQRLQKHHLFVIEQLVDAAITSQDLLKPKYRDRIAKGAHPITGHCYVVCEAIYHELSGYTPYVVTHNGDTHWFLKKDEVVVDPTKHQFTDPVPYDQAKRCNFLTENPSERAVELLRRALKWRRNAKKGPSK